jgi:hypothetical protein
MASYKITSPDGQVYRVNAPDDASEDEVMAYAQKSFKMAAAPAEPTLAQSALQHGKNALGGLIRGAGSIGATLKSPFDIAESAIAKRMGADLPAPDRRSGMDEALTGMGADPESLMFKGTKLVGEVAGTAGVGGALANGLRALPFAAKAAPVIEAVASSGMRAGGLTGAKALGARTVGGAISGGATAGLVNPEDAGMGVLIGGALPGGVQAAKALGSGAKNLAAGVTKHTLGTSTGTGAESVGTAYRAGKQGGTAFMDNLRGKVPFTDVLDEAKTALSKMRIDRSNQYKQGMAGVSADKTVIDFAPIDSAVGSLKSMGNYKGQVINKNASGTVDEIADLVGQWKALDQKEFHTPEGLDALKQAISDIRDTTQLGTAARKAADTAYNAVKGQITMQAPTYAKVMKDYSEASELVKEIERSLVGNQKTAADTAMRKLQSLMRNNVNTNYGNRLDLARTLEGKGADILPAVAGQAMSSWTPRGLQGLSASGIGAAGVMTSNPAALAMLPFTSPRLMGEAAYGLGAMNRGIGRTATAGGNKLAQLLAQQQGGLLTMDDLAPLLATGTVLSASQR